jgi:hypothetical protein
MTRISKLRGRPSYRLEDIPAHLRRDVGLPDPDPGVRGIGLDLFLFSLLRLK